MENNFFLLYSTIFSHIKTDINTIEFQCYPKNQGSSVLDFPILCCLKFNNCLFLLLMNTTTSLRDPFKPEMLNVILHL